MKDGQWFQTNILLFVTLLTTFISTIAVGILFLYHSYLMLTGQTTWEQASRYRIYYLKDLPDLENPFNEGYFRNVLAFMFDPDRDWAYMMGPQTTTPTGFAQHQRNFSPIQHEHQDWEARTTRTPVHYEQESEEMAPMVVITTDSDTALPD